jgi:RNA polymerase sigma-70 factor (ECF subfamily)
MVPPGNGTEEIGGKTWAADRRRTALRHDDADVSEQPATPATPAGTHLLDIYDSALPQVYGYLLARCGDVPAAEDLTAETFLAAVDAARRDPGTGVSVPWLIGVARHKLVDHWRARAREERGLRAVHSDPVLAEPDVSDPWDERLDALLAKQTLARLGPHHRSALTLRYLDDLPVPQVAQILGRTLHATEALLVRAREAFRRTYTDLQTNPGTHDREEDDRG